MELVVPRWSFWCCGRRNMAVREDRIASQIYNKCSLLSQLLATCHMNHASTQQSIDQIDESMYPSFYFTQQGSQEILKM